MMRVKRTYRRRYANRRRERMVAKSWQCKQQARQLAEVRAQIEQAGLLSAGKEAPFFKALGIGEEHNTGFKARGQWWAPAYLVRLNLYMKKYGISHKLRVRTIRSYLEGKEPPASVLGALVGYTEEQLQQR